MKKTGNTALLLGNALREKGLKLSVAESCTGGLLANLITDISGSSDYFMGGIVAYDNKVKKTLLGVREDTLKRVGAVSRETALQMAEGAKKRVKADISASITGIAGPGGGSAKKPVGTVYICVLSAKKRTVKKFLFKGGRKSIKRQSAEAALSMLCKVIGVKE